MIDFEKLKGLVVISAGFAPEELNLDSEKTAPQRKDAREYMIKVSTVADFSQATSKENYFQRTATNAGQPSKINLFQSVQFQTNQSNFG